MFLHSEITKTIACIAMLLTMSIVGKSASPIVIAHRGASGYLPEHTLEAKALAHAMGADFLEQDLVLSKDDIPVVLHDIFIDTVTDVASRFPSRQRDDGRYYALDFTVAELKQLQVTERINAQTRKAVFPGRFPEAKSAFQIPTLEEELEFIAGLNKSTGRVVGIYPEIKQPAWHRKQGRNISRIVLTILERHGYRTKKDPCWVQCFEYTEIKRIREEFGWQGRLVMLLGSSKGEDGIDYELLRTVGRMSELAKWVDGIGPPLSSIFSRTNDGDHRITTLVNDAHACNLVVHPYTVRADELPKNVVSIEELHRLLFVEAGVDGVFTDFPDKTVAFVRAIH